MGLRAGARGDLPGRADADALDRLDRDHRLRDPPVELLRPGDVRAEPRDQAPGAHLEGPAEALVLLAQAVDLLDHRAPRSSGSRQRTGSSSTPSKSAGSRSWGAGASTPAIRVTWLRIVTPTAARNCRASRAGGDARRGLAGARALEHVAGVLEAVLLQAGEVGVAGTRQVDLLDALAALPRAHPLDPVLVVAVGDQQRDRAAQRASRGGPRSGPRRSPSRSSSARRGRGRAGAAPCRGRGASRSSSRPAGMPSTIAVRPGPWDSPAVTKSKRAIYDAGG